MKMRKKLSKMVKNCKQKMDDQMWYLKEFYKNLDISDIADKAVNWVVAPAILMMSLVIISLISQNLHEQYLENKVTEDVVYIQSGVGAKIQGSGTGFHMKTPNGKVVIVTNAHICGLANDKGELLVNEKQHSGRLIMRHVWEVFQKNDLCVVEPLPGYKGIEMADKVGISDHVWAFGYPMGEGLNISKGRVKDFKKIWLVAEDVETASQCKGERYKMEKIQMFIFVFDVCLKSFDSISTDVPTYPGNSGSPLLNVYGNVVGVVFASNGATHWGSAVPLDDLKELMSAY